MPRTTAVPPAPADPPDELLMQRVAGGDGSALAVLVARHDATLMRAVRRFTSSAAAAQDVVQDVWLKLWTQAHRYDPTRGVLVAWLRRVAVHRAIDLRRRTRPVADLEPDTLHAPAGDAPDAHTMRAQHAARVDQALGALPARQREALTLCYHGGLTAAQAGARLGLSTKAVEALLVRARRTLRRELADLLP